MDRFGSRRVWENSQRGCLILRHPKSYLPTHSVIHKSAIRVLAIFADASRTGYAEAKDLWPHRVSRQIGMQAAQATLRQRYTLSLGTWWRVDASRTGYAEAKLFRTLRIALFCDASRTGYAEAKRFTNGLCVTFARDASRTGYAEAKAPMSCRIWLKFDASRTGYAEAKLCRLVELAGVADASRTGYAEAKSHCQPSCSTPVEDASRTGYCARQKQTSAARQEIFECVEKQNQWH